MTSNYRTDIDGLRAVAVLLVLLFHLDVDLISGGYIGVDVFFVISGYLISKNILTEIDTTGKFSFKTFYIRRARRLFPALLATVVVTLIVAMVLFEPQHLKRTAGAAIYTLGFISNFYFWQEGGYFALSSDYKPLLHTWSLSVEEQYYLFYPIGLFILRKWLKPITLITLVALLIISLLLSDYLYYDAKPYAAFFLLPTRIFEFLTGALILFVTHNKKQTTLSNQILIVVGLSAIVFSAIAYNADTPSPTLLALVPCLGAAALLFSGPCSLRTLLLENKLMTWIGKTSYSIYLVHWPLIVFYGYSNHQEWSQLTTLLLFVGSIALGAALHYTIEKPLRFGKPTTNPQHSKFLLGYLSIVGITLVFSSIFWARGSLSWRNSANYLSTAEIAGFNEALARKDHEASFRSNGFTDAETTKLLFIGDSHVEDSAFALYTAISDLDYEVDTLRFDSFCQPENDYRHIIAKSLATLMGRTTQCQSQLDSLTNSDKVTAATHIFFANLSIEKTAKHFPQHLSTIKARTNAKLIVIGQNANFSAVDNFDALQKNIDEPLGDYLYTLLSNTDKDISSFLRNMSEKENIFFIDRAALVCSDTTSTCHVIEDDKILYRDSTHWNHYGRQYYGRALLEKLQDENIL